MKAICVSFILLSLLSFKPAFGADDDLINVSQKRAVGAVSIYFENDIFYIFRHFYTFWEWRDWLSKML